AGDPLCVTSSKSTFWLLLLVAAYATAHELWYSQTALGQSPALDGLENLQLAGQIARGELPVEPFYRAMLYPATLALVGGHWMLLGFACHLANAYLAYRLARTIWRRQCAGLVAGALTGFNPVLLHYAFDPLDVTLSITLLLAGLNALFAAAGRHSSDLENPRALASNPQPEPDAIATNAEARAASPRSRLAWAAAAGILLAFSALARPHGFAILPPLVLI